MTGLKILAAVALLSGLTASAAYAQSGFASSHPDTYEAENPNRNLNGTLTPAGRLGLELPDGAAPAQGADSAMARGWHCFTFLRGALSILRSGDEHLPRVGRQPPYLQVTQSRKSPDHVDVRTDGQMTRLDSRRRRDGVSNFP